MESDRRASLDGQLNYWTNAANSSNTWELVRYKWTEEDFKKRTDETVLNFFHFSLTKEDVFVDLGCGLGYVCKMVAPHVKEYIGVDFCQEMLDKAISANSEIKNARFIKNDGFSIPLADNSVDVLICEQMFLHVEENAVIKDHEHSLIYFHEVKRVLKQDGRLCLQLPKCEHYQKFGINGFDRAFLQQHFNDEDIVNLSDGHSSIYVVRNITRNENGI